MNFYWHSYLFLLVFCSLFLNIEGVRRGNERIIIPGAIEDVYLSKMRNLDQFNNFTGESFTLDNVPMNIYKKVTNLSTEEERNRCKKRHEQEKQKKEISEQTIEIVKKKRENIARLVFFIAGSAGGVALVSYYKPVCTWLVDNPSTLWKTIMGGCGLYTLFSACRYLYGLLEDFRKTNNKYNLVGDHLISFLTNNSLKFKSHKKN